MIIKLAGILAPIVLAFSYVPQIISLYKTKETAGIDPRFWYTLDLGLLLFVILAVDAGATSLIIAQGFNLGLALVVTGQVIYYRRN